MYKMQFYLVWKLSHCNNTSFHLKRVRNKILVRKKKESDLFYFTSFGLQSVHFSTFSFPLLLSCLGKMSDFFIDAALV